MSTFSDQTLSTYFGKSSFSYLSNHNSLRLSKPVMIEECKGLSSSSNYFFGNVYFIKCTSVDDIT